MEILKDAYVAFIDVIGFKNLVCSDNKQKLDTIFEKTKLAFDMYDEQKENIKKFILSDSIILAIEPGDHKKDRFKMILTASRNLQAFLAVEGILVRGAISQGDFQYENWGKYGKIFYGKGFISACELEKKAVYPRIILDPRLIPNFANDKISFIKVAAAGAVAGWVIQNV